MKKLQMPSSYAVLSAEEQRAVCGGGELGDALDSFLGNLHIDDFFFGGGLISLSFTFVPMLLFNVVKLGIRTAAVLYEQFGRFLGLTSDAADSAVQLIFSFQPQNTEQTNSGSVPVFPVK